MVTLPLLGEVTFSAGVLFFPISYIFGDILTEVYGYGRDRRVVWAGFAALAFASAMAAWIIRLSPGRTSTVRAGPANFIAGASGAMRPCSAPRRPATSAKIDDA